MRQTPFRHALAVVIAAASFAAAAPALADNAALGRAQAAVGRGDYALAEKELAGVASGSDRLEAQLALARIQLVTGRYDEAANTAKGVASTNRDARDNAAPIRAKALASQGKMAEAIAILREVEHDDSARLARLVLGELLIQTGKRTEARTVLMTIVDDYTDDKIKNNPFEIAMAAHAADLVGTNDPKNTNDVFKEALRAGATKLVDPLLWHAHLYLETDDPGDAGESIRAALKVAPKDPAVLTMLARVKLENALDFEAAESAIGEALKVNPQNTAAYSIRAGLSLRDLDLANADRAVDTGLKINPSDLELLSMKAAIRFLADDKAGYEQVKQKVLTLNPLYSRFFRIVAEYAEWEHRYDDIVKMMREAIQVDPADAKAYAALGMNLIRIGDDKGAQAALDKSWAMDNTNVRVKNERKSLFDRVAVEYTTVDGQPFTIRYHNDDKAILERYVPQMLEEAWGSMVKRYGFTPKTPVKIELYAEEETFSVRVSGLPHVGIQGVCFGQTLAAMSPSAGPFNWGNVLWHELGHVFAIQMSKSHVPRWFTEGLSEYETIVRRPEWQREEDPALFAALKGGRIPPVDGFNRAFTHVDDVSDVTMAYYAASQILVFMSQEFGFPKVVAMLPRWGNGEHTPEVVKNTLGITSEELDKRFRAWLAPRLVRYAKQYVPDLHAPPLEDARKAVKADPKSARKMVELSLALGADKQIAEAEATLDEALKLDPKQPDAHFIKLKMAFAKKDLPEATRLIKKMIADGNDGYIVRMKAADLAEVQRDEAQVKVNLEVAHQLDPSQVEPLQGLYDFAHKKKDDNAELWALQRIAMIDQHDRRAWNLLLQKLVDRGMWEEARKTGESAMFVDVQNAKTHRLYARALARTGNMVSAIYELNSALVCKPSLKVQADIYGELATGYDKLKEAGMATQAREFQRQIVGSPAFKDEEQKEQKGPKQKHHDPTEGT